MKNLILYVHPRKDFDKERHTLVKIQIDNSLELGWKKEDILLVTNFSYEYEGIKAIYVENENYCGIDDTQYQYRVSSHILTITTLLNQGLIEKDQIYWYHDMDAYQLHEITEEELGITKVDIALTDYGWSPKWNGGSVFFKESGKDLFNLWREHIYKYLVGDERTLVRMMQEHLIDETRFKRLNITYNVGMRNIGYNHRIANKPIKVLHFHPHYYEKSIPDTTLNMFMYGKNNGVGIPLMTERLIKLFNKYGIQ